MTRVVVLTSGKGGVGKTTCTANLGMALAQKGQRIAVIDADFGLRNLDLLLGLENRIVFTALDVLAGDCRLEQALVKDKRQPNLALLPAAQNRSKESITPEQMMELVSKLAAAKYDFIFIDCPAGIEGGFKNAIAAAKEAIVVTTPGNFRRARCRSRHWPARGERHQDQAPHYQSVETGHGARRSDDVGTRCARHPRHSPAGGDSR